MLNYIFRIFIRGYQYTIGTVLPNSCRFTPTCSEYTYQALTRYGLKVGSLLALRRILRCHPFSWGGYDPVPEKNEVKAKVKLTKPNSRKE